MNYVVVTLVRCRGKDLFLSYNEDMKEGTRTLLFLQLHILHIS